MSSQLIISPTPGYRWADEHPRGRGQAWPHFARRGGPTFEYGKVDGEPQHRPDGQAWLGDRVTKRNFTVS